MSFSRYPKYKASGVEWLGEVPEHWDTRRLGFYFRERRERVSDKDFEPLSVTMKGIVPRIDTAAKSDDGENRKKVCVGDFVINTRSDRKGSAGVSTLRGSVSLISTVLEPQDAVVCGFIHHLLRSVNFQEEYYRYGKGIVADLWSTNFSEMRNILLAMPPVREQLTIAAFLDYETAKIDELVAEQERLIELLKEKRQAVISHAVTKGLNPDAPMRDSGIEWLGEVPEHWEVCDLNYALSAIGDIDHYMPESVDKGVPYVMTGDLTDFASGIDFESCKQVSHNDYLKLSKRIKSSKGDVVMARYATIGTASFIDVDREFLVSYSCVTIKPNPSKALGLYIFNYFKSLVFFQGIQQQVNTNTQGNVGVNDLKKIKVTLPNLTEQAEIIEYLAFETAKFTTLTTEANRVIDLLKERRTALISAAVTGQIDVRNLVSVESA